MTPPSACDEDIGLMDSGELTFTRDAFGRLHLRRGEQTFAGVRPVRTFPLVDPTHLIAILDGEGHELGLIEDMAALAPDSRRIVSEELDLLYFTARVQAIRDVKSRHGVTTWELETDRGPRSTYLKSRGNIRSLPKGHVVLTDVYGVKYDIPNINDLDEHSRRLLEDQL